jgi:hypothetical protein
MSTITYRGVTIWAAATNGAGWKFVPSGLARAAIRATPAVGTGHWLKPGNVEPAGMTLELQWRVSGPNVPKALVEPLADHQLGALVVPAWGTYLRVQLVGVGEFDAFKSDAATGWIVRSTLEFLQFP